MAKLTIRPGTTYLTRSGERVYCVAETNWPGHWRMRCEDENGVITYRHHNGKFDGAKHLDLITEVDDR